MFFYKSNSYGKGNATFYLSIAEAKLFFPYTKTQPRKMSHMTSIYWGNETNIYSSQKERDFLPDTVKVRAQDLTAGIVTTIIATETQRIYKKPLTDHLYAYIHTFAFRSQCFKYEDLHAFTFSFERDVVDLRIKLENYRDFVYINSDIFRPLNKVLFFQFEWAFINCFYLKDNAIILFKLWKFVSLIRQYCNIKITVSNLLHSWRMQTAIKPRVPNHR